MLVLCLLAVVRTLRYTHWLKFHQVLSIVFLGLTLHCVRLMDTTDFMMSFGWLNLIITVAGSVAALILLFRGPGAKLREEGTIVETACEGRYHQVGGRDAAFQTCSSRSVRLPCLRPRRAASSVLGGGYRQVEGLASAPQAWRLYGRGRSERSEGDDRH